MAPFLAAVLAWTLGAAAQTPADLAVYAHLGEVTSLDPSGPYDAVSQAAIYNLYETLIAFKGASLTEFEPRLATEVPTLANGGVSKDGRVYRFKIRRGVKFHSGAEMTPEDVRYSLLRFMLMDRAGGPSSLLLEPILGVSSTRGKDNKIAVRLEDAEKAVRLEGGTLVVTLARPFAPFLSIMARWSYVLPKAKGGWDGTAATWEKFNDPRIDSTALFASADGTGPFRLERWDRAEKLLVTARHDGYWRGPAKLQRVIWRSVSEFATRRLMLQAGDADLAEVQRPFVSQLDGLKGVQVADNLPRLMTDPAMFFTLDINPVGNPDIGSGRLDGNGIPPDFFQDPDVRKGFAYAFDYQAYLAQALKGKGQRAGGPVPPGLLPNSPPPVFERSVEKAKAHFKKARGGQVWEKGFTLTMSFNTGSDIREAACQILKKTVEELNPKFKINTRPIDWPAFIDKTERRLMPLWSRGWIADYPDPHNFVFPFFHSQGRYAVAQGLKDPELDKLVEAAVAQPDPKRRAEAYRKLQRTGAEKAYQLFTVHPAGIMAVRDGVQGFVDNPVFMGPYFYPISKR